MKKKLLVTGILFLIISAVYIFGSFSKVPFGDCIGFITDVEKRKFILSTNTYAHFLFTNISVFFIKVLPNTESIEIARYLTIFSGSATVVVFFLILYHLKKSVYASLAALIFGFSFSFWKNAEIVEVYSLNTLCISLFLLFFIEFLTDGKRIWLFLGSIILGISLFSHIQNILFFPALGLVLWKFADRLAAIASVGILSLFLSLLFAVPLINGEPLKGVFSADTVLTQIEFSSLLKSLAKSLAILVYNFWYFTPFAYFGAVDLYRNNNNIFWFLLAASLPVYGFAVYFNVSDNYVFFIPFNFIFGIFIGTGILSMMRRKWAKPLLYSVFLMPMFYFLAFSAISNTSAGKNFEALKAYKGGLKYYLLPWMNGNVGIIEFTIDKKTAPEPMDWMTRSAEEFIRLKLSQGYSLEEIKKM